MSTKNKPPQQNDDSHQTGWQGNDAVFFLFLGKEIQSFLGCSSSNEANNKGKENNESTERQHGSTF